MKPTNYDWLWESPKLRELATENMKRFFATLYHLIVEEKKNYDAVSVGGNTGLIMSEFTQMLYSFIGVDTPPIFSFPNQRQMKSSPKIARNTETDLDVAVISAIDQAKQMQVGILSRILFVDDEISKGETAYNSLKVLMDAHLTNALVIYDIVAEDEGFIITNYPENVTVNFSPFAKEIQGIHNLVVYSLPYEIELQLKTVTDSTKRILLILLGLPSRDKTYEKQEYSYEINEIATKSVDNIDDLMEDTRSYYKNLITIAIDEYKKGEINLAGNNYVEEILNSK